jgi:hypothetical protein
VALTVCLSCDKCYGENLPQCSYCNKTTSQQINDSTQYINNLKAQNLAYERGLRDGVNIQNRIYMFFFWWY